MDLCADLGSAVSDLILLRSKVEKELPGNTWYKNELRRLQDEGQELEVRVKKFDELRSNGRLFLKVPQFEITDVARDIKLLTEGIVSLNQHLDLDVQQFGQRERGALAIAGAAGTGKVDSDKDGTRTPTKVVKGVGLIGGSATPKGLPSPPTSAGSGAGNSNNLGGLAVLSGNVPAEGFVTPERKSTLAPFPSVIPATPSSLGSNSSCQCCHCAGLSHMFDSPGSNSSDTMTNVSSPHLLSSPASSWSSLVLCPDCANNLLHSPASSLSSICQCPHCAPEMHPDYPNTPSSSSVSSLFTTDSESESGYGTLYSSQASRN